MECSSDYTVMIIAVLISCHLLHKPACPASVKCHLFAL